MEFKITKKQVKPGMFKKVVKEEPSEMHLNKKTYARYIINEDVFDLHDSVADNAKAISLIFSLLRRIYENLPDDIKDNIPEEDRQIIEYAFEKHKSIKTRADVQFIEEGVKMIDKIFDRQKKIGEIIANIYNIKIENTTSSQTDSETTDTTTESS
jgi:hypothetical protein